jgi:dTDP-4-dehydrorhamnose reductase
MALYDAILITGGRGMLAQAFAAVLTARGLDPTVVGRAECDISNPLDVAFTIERVQPTLLINCAGYTKVDLAEKERQQANAANGIGPGILAGQCRHHAIPLVHFSTDYVFDGRFTRPLRATDPCNPQSAYGKSKFLGEQNIQKHAPDRWMIVRAAWLYGPNGPNFVQTMLNAARAGKPLRVVDDQIGSPTYTFDLAAATLDLLDRDASGIWHITNAGQTNWFAFAQAIFEEWGLSPDLQPISSEQWKSTKPDSAARPAYSVLDISPVELHLGRSMRHWRDALRDYHASQTS